MVLAAELVLQAAYLPSQAPGLARTLRALVPVSYQGPILGLCAIGVFLSVHALVAPASPLASEPWAVPRPHPRRPHLRRLLLHLLLAYLFARATGHPTFYGERTVPGILLQNAAVIVAAFLVAAVLVRVPVLRRTV